MICSNNLAERDAALWRFRMNLKSPGWAVPLSGNGYPLPVNRCRHMQEVSR